MFRYTTTDGRVDISALFGSSGVSGVQLRVCKRRAALFVPRHQLIVSVNGSSEEKGRKGEKERENTKWGESPNRGWNFFFRFRVARARLIDRLILTRGSVLLANVVLTSDFGKSFITMYKYTICCCTVVLLICLHYCVHS